MPSKLGLPLLTPAQAAEHLAISTRQLRDLTTAGAIRYVNIGRFDRETRRYSPEDLEAFIEERRRRSISAVALAPARRARDLEIVDFGALREKRRSERLRAKKP